MGSGTAKSVRLELGIDLRERIHRQKGTDDDILLVQQEAPSFMDEIAHQFVERANLIRGACECFRLMHDEVVIEIPALKRPTLKEVQKSWNYIRNIDRDDSTEEPVTLRLSTVLQSTEGSNEATYERRLMVLRDKGSLLGFQHEQYVLKVQKRYPALMALLGKVYIDFPGLVVVTLDGRRRFVPCGGSDGEQFVEYWRWLGHGFNDNGRVAVSAQ